jgi:hypothetical protein
MSILILCFAAAFLYNRYSSRVYEASASLSPVENKTSSILSSNQLFGGIESLQSLNNTENDMTNLNSFALVYSTVISMNLEISYFREKQSFFKQTDELYETSPFTVTLDKSHIQPINAKIFISVLDDSSYRLIISEKRHRCITMLITRL